MQEWVVDVILGGVVVLGCVQFQFVFVGVFVVVVYVVYVVGVGIVDCCFEVGGVGDYFVGENGVVVLVVDVQVVWIGDIEFDCMVDVGYQVLYVFVVLVGVDCFGEVEVVVGVVVWVYCQYGEVVGCVDLLVFYEFVVELVYWIVMYVQDGWVVFVFYVVDWFYQQCVEFGVVGVGEVQGFGVCQLFVGQLFVVVGQQVQVVVVECGDIVGVQVVVVEYGDVVVVCY